VHSKLQPIHQMGKYLVSERRLILGWSPKRQSDSNSVRHHSRLRPSVGIQGSHLRDIPCALFRSTQERICQEVIVLLTPQVLMTRWTPRLVITKPGQEANAGAPAAGSAGSAQSYRLIHRQTFPVNTLSCLNVKNIGILPVYYGFPPPQNCVRPNKS